MTYEEIKALVASFGLPYTYYQFPDNTQQAPPFVAFFFDGIDDLYADDRNYQPIRHLNIELYTDRKDFELEKEFEARLEALSLPYDKEVTFLDSERMHMTSYEMDVVITTEKEEQQNA